MLLVYPSFQIHHIMKAKWWEYLSLFMTMLSRKQTLDFNTQTTTQFAYQTHKLSGSKCRAHTKPSYLHRHIAKTAQHVSSLYVSHALSSVLKLSGECQGDITITCVVWPWGYDTWLHCCWADTEDRRACVCLWVWRVYCRLCYCCENNQIMIVLKRAWYDERPWRNDNSNIDWRLYLKE